jgi:hypothetical protein
MIAQALAQSPIGALDASTELLHVTSARSAHLGASFVQ